MDDSSVKPIEKNASLAGMAYESIREAIVTGRIKPGERLGQVELAHALGVSERTVREAFARLVAKGLAVHEPYKGVRVAELALEELRQVYIMRALLEGHAMQSAAGRITHEDLARMHALLPATVAGSTPQSVKAAQEANREFHWIPIRAAGSQILDRVLEQLWEMMFAYDVLYQGPGDQAISQRDYQQHVQLLEALECHDGEQAAEVNTRHIYTTVDALLAKHGDG